MDKVIKLEVTADDIRLSRRKSSRLCPIARAAKRKGIAEVRVHSDGMIHCYDGNGGYVWLGADGARSFTERCERLGLNFVEPTTFDFRVWCAEDDD